MPCRPFLPSSLLATALLLIAATTPANTAPARCSDDRTIVQPGDTLSAIAQRCDVPEGTILAVNPQFNGSGDLQVGTTVRVGPREGAGARLAQTLSRFGKQANGALDRLADRIGPSAQDVLDRNPELKSRLDGITGQLGLPSDRPEASLAISPPAKSPGATTSVKGKDMPRSVSVTIGAGPPGVAYCVIQSSETTSTGTLDANVSVPTDVAGSQTVFVVADADGRVIARSDPVELTR